MEIYNGSVSEARGRVAAGFGALGVALGAFGAHGLSAQLAANDTVSVWETASQYHLLHAVALYAMALGAPSRRRAWLLLFVGTLVFSGSLYGLAVGGPRWLGPVTPLGGLLMILGWGCLAWPVTAAPTRAE